MRRIDMTNMQLIHHGSAWQHEGSPCDKSMISKLERNENLVYWLQPRGAPITAQIPALRIGDDFYTLSLRMMKAIWRHVRLSKGFRNIESAHLGGLKLRIPSVLLAEKKRTQTRFNVLRMSTPAAKKTKTVTSAASKVSRVVCDFFLPLGECTFPEYTSFSPTGDVEEAWTFDRLLDLFPDDVKTKEDVVNRVVSLYDQSMRTRVFTAPT